MTDTELEAFIRARIPTARKQAAAVGPLHSAWDVIIDAEQLLAGKPTLIDGTKSEKLLAIAEALAGYEPQSAKTSSLHHWQVFLVIDHDDPLVTKEVIYGVWAHSAEAARHQAKTMAEEDGHVILGTRKVINDEEILRGSQ